MKPIMYLLLVLLLLSACAPTAQATDQVVVTLPPDSAVTSPPEGTEPTNEPMENPFASQPDDSKLTRGPAFLTEANLIIRESYPPQISLEIKGELPTPCNQLRVDITDPTTDNKINVEVFSVVDPDLMCTQVTAPFEESVDLGTFPSGHYSVFVNGELAGEFDS